MRKLATGLLGTVALVAAAACTENTLAVDNSRNPDQGNVLGNPTSVEQLLQTSYQTIHRASHNTANSVTPQSEVLSLESYASVANFGMASRATQPRVAIANDRGNQSANENFYDFSNLQQSVTFISHGVEALDALIAKKPDILGSIGRTQRARAWGFLAIGIGYGNVSMTYDSAAIYKPHDTLDPINPPALVAYPAVNQVALDMLDSAIAIATAVPAAEVSNFSSTDWIRGLTVSRNQFLQIAHSFKARFRAGVARSVTERKAVDWSQVIADVNAGITSDLIVTLSSPLGWRHGWIYQAYVYQGWHMQPQLMIAMADTSGAFAGWLNTAVNQRTPFLIVTPDQRFPSGDTRAAQQTAAGNLPGASGKPYFRNRPTGEDTFGDGWANSYYDNYRFRVLTLNNADGAGPWPEITVSEMRLLAAEGDFYANNFAAALPLINASRTANGLPALVAADNTTPVPGSANGCVPHVPTVTGGTYTTPCATMWEALKYEKRLETAFTGYNQWWIDSRGWGDLAEGTAVQWPVPYQEMDARNHPFYNLGGVGLASGAPKGTYGY